MNISFSWELCAGNNELVVIRSELMPNGLCTTTRDYPDIIGYHLLSMDGNVLTVDAALNLCDILNAIVDKNHEIVNLTNKVLKF